MPRYQVVEHRMHKSGYLIDAASEDDARGLNGDVIDEANTDDWGYEVLSVEEVDQDTNVVGPL